jgi:hypothetical protein
VARGGTTTAASGSRSVMVGVDFRLDLTRDFHRELTRPVVIIRLS